MRIVIMGAGAIGCYLAARLSDAGERVTLVGHPEQVAAISAHGLLVRDSRDDARNRADGKAAVARRYQLPTVAQLADIEPGTDLVLLAVKTQDVSDACRELRTWRDQNGMAPETPVLALQNGLRADALAAQELGEASVVGGVVMCATTFTQLGEISVQFPGWLIVGEPFGPVRERTRTIVRALNGAVPTFLTGDLRAVRWSKLITNLNNGICAATGLTMPEVARTPTGALLAARVMKEGQRVAKATGAHLDHGLYGLSPRAMRRDGNAALVALLQSGMNSVLAHIPDAAAARVLALAGRGKLGGLPIHGSTWQSLARSKPSEIAYLNGEIARLGAELGVATPCNSRLVALVHEIERGHPFYPLPALEPTNRPDLTPSSFPAREGEPEGTRLRSGASSFAGERPGEGPTDKEHSSR